MKLSQLNEFNMEGLRNVYKESAEIYIALHLKWLTSQIVIVIVNYYLISFFEWKKLINKKF